MKTGRPRIEPTAPQELTKLFYSIDEVAALLEVHPNTIRRLIKEGKLKSERVGRQHRIKKETLQSI